MRPQAIRLHNRDYSLLSELGEVGILDTPTIHRRHFPLDTTGEACLRRLRLYAGNGLILSTPHPLSAASTHGGRPQAVHRLTPFGAETVFARTGMLPPRVARADTLKPDTLQHRLGVAAIHLAVNDACAQHGLPKPQWILEQDTNPDASPGAPFTERFVLYELFKNANQHVISCRPDASTWLRIPTHSAQNPSEWLDLLIYWEFDRATETLARITRKIEGYRLLLQTETYRKHWPAAHAPTVRVFFVVPSQERLRNIAAAIRKCPGSEMIRLAVVSAPTPAHLLTKPIWETATGEKRQLWTPFIKEAGG